MINKLNYLFPIAFMSNALSMTVFLICLGLVGQTEMAADVSIVQGATLALFYGLSGNARNLILNEHFSMSAKSILVARIILSIPIAYLAFWLSVNLSGVDGYLAFILILRRVVEWFGEVHLSEMERIGNHKFSRKYLVIQVTFLIVVLVWYIGKMPFPLLGLALWAISPLFLSGQFIYEALNLTLSKQNKALDWQGFLPHLGSTTIIGVTVYIFRLLIIALLGKAESGDLFTAFALGGVLGSIFVNGIGPSLAFHQKKYATRKLPILVNVALITSGTVGVLVFFVAAFKFDILAWVGKSAFFWEATGVSMIGGIVMVYAQIIRHRLLQHHEDQDLYGPDVLMNILIIAIVPFVYGLFGTQGMIWLFLFNALIAFLFYFSSEMKDKLIMSDVAFSLISGLLLLPIFFQMSGGLFRDTAIIFNSEHISSKLPISISVFACFGAILMIGSYRRANLALNVIYFTFILMIAGSVLGAHEQLGQLGDKLISLIQFILPMFGLVLAQMYEPKPASLYIEKSFLYVLVAIVPLQLLSVWLHGSVYLHPYLYVFSIYQHLQYTPVIFVSAFLIALCGLWSIPKYKKILLVLALFMAIYVAASMSILAIGLLFFGLLGCAIYYWKLNSEKLLFIVSLVVIVVGCCYLTYGKDKLLQKYTTQTEVVLDIGNSSFKSMQLPISLNEIMLDNVKDRATYWNFYIDEIFSSTQVFLIGHAERADRSKYPSAYNYYLDFIYSFGVLALLPILLMFWLTLKKIYDCRWHVFATPSLLCLSAMVLFLLIVDNSIKVSLKQPYSGIYSFFLWGLLISKLSQVTQHVSKA